MDLGKRGISGVVATVLIILVTVAAATIVWITIVPMIQEKLGVLNAPEADIEIDTVRGYTGYDPTRRIASVNVKKGPSPINISKINFIVSIDGNSETYEANFDLKPGESKIFYILDINQPDSISIAPVIDLGNKFELGKEGLKIEIPGSFNLAANILTADNTATLVSSPAPVPGGDTTPPVVSVSGPVSELIGNEVLVTATASDASGINNIKIYIDNVLVNSCASSNCQYMTTYSSAATHNYYATANDNSPNQNLGRDPATGTKSFTIADPSAFPFGLVSRWRFDVDILDSEVANNDGTAVGGASYTLAGKINAAYRFDGATGYISIPDSSTLDVSSITISAWINMTQAKDSLILSKNSAYQLRMLSTRRLRGVVYLGGAYTSIDSISTATVPLNVWTHVAMTYSSGSYKLYINNAEVATLSSTGTISTNTQSASIGGSGTGPFFNGTIDEVMLFNRQLASTEITQIYGL